MHLRGSLKKYFYSFLEKEFPDTFNKITSLYDTSYVKRKYTQKLNEFLFELKKKYKIYNLRNYIEPDIISYKDSCEQLDLFENSQ